MEREQPGLVGSVGNFLARKGRRVWNLRVTEKRTLTSRMIRVAFTADDLDELVWQRGQDLVLELPQDDGSIARRHYTIRDHRPGKREIDIDFVAHGEGAAMRWLDEIGPGARIEAAGPRGHTHLREADWHLFLGDETCMPGIFAMLEGLAPDAKAHAFLEVEDEADVLAPAAAIAPEFLFRRAPAAPNTVLLDRLTRFAFPPGEGQAYVIGETSTVRALRHHLTARDWPKDRIVSEGYWRPGRIGGHDHV
jgi:NADPH-dependent ferric siderophore reductase